MYYPTNCLPPCLLSRLVIQRTKRIDDSQELLLAMLEDLTSGTELERQEFMASCVEILQRFSKRDMITPIFVYERLCSIIHPVSGHSRKASFKDLCMTSIL